MIGLTVSTLATSLSTPVYAEKDYDREVKSKVGFTLDVGGIQQVFGNEDNIVRIEGGKLYLDKVGTCYVTLLDGTVLYLSVLDKYSTEEMVLGDGIIAESQDEGYEEGVSDEGISFEDFTDLNQDSTNLETGNDDITDESEIQTGESTDSDLGKKETESGDEGFTSVKDTEQKSEISEEVEVTATPTPVEAVSPTETPIPTETPRPTDTPRPTPTEKINPTPTESIKDEKKDEDVKVTPTPKESVEPTETPIPTVTPKESPEPTVTPTVAPTETPVPSITPSVEPTKIPTETPTPSVKPTETPAPTVTPSPMETPTPTETPSPTPTEILKKEDEGKVSVDDILKGKEVDTGITPEDTTEVSLNSKKLKKNGVAKVKSNSKIRESSHTGSVGTYFVLPILEGDAKEYLSTDESVAKVSANGTVVLVGEGRAKVFVTTDDKVYACNVISLNTDFDNSDVLLDWGTSSYQLEVGGTFLGEKPTYSLFKGSDIASIDENGLLTFSGSGDVIVQTDVAGLKLNKKFIRNSRRKYLWDGMQPAIEQCLGTPYVFGGETPGAGLDCSAYVSYVLRSVGLMSGRESAQGLYNMFGVTSNPQPGDIVYFTGTYDADGDYITHVGIYAGDGMMYHSGKPNQKQAIVGYYAEHLVGYGSITGE